MKVLVVEDTKYVFKDIEQLDNDFYTAMDNIVGEHCEFAKTLIPNIYIAYDEYLEVDSTSIPNILASNLCGSDMFGKCVIVRLCKDQSEEEDLKFEAITSEDYFKIIEYMR